MIWKSDKLIIKELSFYIIQIHFTSSDVKVYILFPVRNFSVLWENFFLIEQEKKEFTVTLQIMKLNNNPLTHQSQLLRKSHRS